MCAHVNLIPLNHVEERQFQPSTAEHMKAFIKILEDEGVNVTVRRKLGGDVDASCGQLRRKMQKNAVIPGGDTGRKEDDMKSFGLTDKGKVRKRQSGLLYH